MMMLPTMTMTVWVATLYTCILTHHLVLNVNSIQLEKETLHSFSSLSVGDTPLLREWLTKNLRQESQILSQSIIPLKTAYHA